MIQRNGYHAALDLSAVWDRYERATACLGPPNVGWNLAIASARDVPPLLAEVERLAARVAEQKAALRETAMLHLTAEARVAELEGELLHAARPIPQTRIAPDYAERDE